jgi:hypothetical protein
MSTDRTAALAIIIGSVAGLVTMALHPTGGDVARNALGGTPNILAGAVHWLGLLAQALVLAGTLALTLRLRVRRDVAVGGYVFFALASVAVTVAAVASGIVAPGVLRGLGEADGTQRALMMSALAYTRLLNRAFAAVYVVCSGVAILLWSGAILAGRELTRALAVCGVVLGTALVLGLASGHLRLGVHDFGVIVLSIGGWLSWAAVQLWRSAER